MKAARWIAVVGLVAGGAVGGWWVGMRMAPRGTEASVVGAGAGPCPGGAEALYWKAPMDPTYVRDEPG